jgi:AraC-like DNA-binding protein
MNSRIGATSSARPALSWTKPLNRGANRDDEEIVTSSATIRQTGRTLIRRLRFDQCLVIAVDVGAKHARSSKSAVSAGPGGLLILPPHAALDVINTTFENDEGELYQARLLNLGNDAAPPASEWQAPLLAEPTFIERPCSELMAVFSRVHSALRDGVDQPAAIHRHRLQELTLWIQHLLGCRLPLGSAIHQPVASRVRYCVQQNLAVSWEAGSVASALAMSEATLRRKLRAEATSFTAELREARLNHALQLLQTVDWSVDAIAAEVGYASPSRFAERFRDRFDLPPSAFRKAGNFDRLRGQFDRLGRDGKAHITARSS